MINVKRAISSAGISVKAALSGAGMVALFECIERRLPDISEMLVNECFFKASKNMTVCLGMGGLVSFPLFARSVLNDFPILVPVFEITAPLLVIIANSLLPVILESVTLLEGPISGAVIGASLFVKLAAFMIIQTFFVSAISGSVIDVSVSLDVKSLLCWNECLSHHVMY